MPQIEDKRGKIYVNHINIRQSIFFLMLKLIFLDLIAAFFSILYFFSVSSKYMPETLNNFILSYNFSFFLILVFLQIALTVYVVLFWINEYYEISPNFVIHRNGLFLRKAEKHPFAQMRSVRVEQDFFGKIFGYGTIYLYNWYLRTSTSLYLIHNPIKYYHIIENLIPKSEKEKEIFLDKPDQDES
jgi:hypothetical protein